MNDTPWFSWHFGNIVIEKYNVTARVFLKCLLSFSRTSRLHKEATRQTFIVCRGSPGNVPSSPRDTHFAHKTLLPQVIDAFFQSFYVEYPLVSANVRAMHSGSSFKRSFLIARCTIPHTVRKRIIIYLASKALSQ